MELIIWIGLCIAVGYWAISRGRSFWFGFLWACALSPFIGALIVGLSENRNKG
jgi:predicted membrane metal-binding protein